MEVTGPAEGLADAVSRQKLLVGLVAAQFPLLPAWRQGGHGRRRQGPPGPLGDRRVAARLVGAGLDEVRVVGVVAHPVPHEAQAGQRRLRRLALLFRKLREGSVVVVGVIPEEGGVNDGHPPDRLADHREGLCPVAGPHLAEPFCRVLHGGEGPPQRADPGISRAARLIGPVLAAPLLLDSGDLAPVLPVPGHPAPGRTEARVLALRLELLAAALTSPSLRHHAMLRVTWRAT